MENSVHQIHVCLKPNLHSANESGFDAWEGFIETCIALHVIAEKEVARLREEVAYIKRLGVADYFWFLYVTCRALQYNGGGFLARGATDFYCLYYLGVIQENPLETPFTGKSMQKGLPKAVFCTSKEGGAWLVEYLQKVYGASVLATAQKVETACWAQGIVAVEIMEKIF